MRTVIFVAPFLMDATLKFVQAAAAVPNTRLVVVTQDRADRLPAGAQHWHVDDATRADVLVDAGRRIAAHTGGLHRITGILEDIQVPIAQARAALGLPGLDPASAERFRDKGLMKATLRAAGLPCARAARVHSEADALAFVREVGPHLVLKPPAGAGSRGTYRVSTVPELRAALADLRPTPQREVLAEEFIQGAEHSFDCITLDGRVVFHNIGRYYPGPLDVVRNPWIQWCVVLPRDISGSEFAAIKEVGPQATRALGLTSGFTHMEWFRRADGSAVVSEVGARPPGAQFTSVMSWAYDRSLYHAWAQATIDGRVDGAFHRSYAAGIAYLRGPGSGRVAAVEGLDVAQRAMGHLVVEARLPVVGQARASGYEGEGYVIVRHPDTRVVEQALTTLIETVKVRYA
jgi:phosphoribosylaminoimidazole carboxylase (NCAIR synthetase)